MLSESTTKIIREISQFINEDGGDCSDWCVGATSDVDLGLLRSRGIGPGYHRQICRCALSAAEARAIVHGFRNLSCTEVVDPNDADGQAAVYVFAFRKPSALTAIPGGMDEQPDSAQASR
jgi:hypothetical protein